jgi:hypothetical protein
MVSRAGLLCVCSLWAALTTSPAYGQADTDRLATATSLFETAQQLVQENHADQACPIFEESFRLEPANGTLINLADCYERLGKTASAWLTFRRVVQRSDQAGQDARADVARKRVLQLEPRLSRLRILVGDSASLAGLTVTRDAIELQPAALGVPVAVDPGSHRVVAKAPGHREWQSELQVAGEGVTIDVILPKLLPLSEVALPPKPARMPVQAQVGIAALVIGGAAAIVGVALGGAAKVKADDADCDGDNFCSPDGLSLREDAVLLGNVGTGVGVAGLALGVLGLTLWLTASSDEPGSDVGLRLRIHPAGITFGSSF